MDATNTLIVRTFGGFSMTWNGTILTGGTKSADTQLLRIMQILLHFRDQGVDRIHLMELLDEDSNADDVHHLLRSVLYNVRKKLKASGLPESNYIEFRSGRYYWTEDIPVFEDASYFEELCMKADTETDPDKKGELCKEVCFLYRGEFLPQQTRLIWVSEEERRYEQMFRMCTDTAADIMRANHDYTGLEALGRHASKVAPYNEWETLTMEALIALGKHRDAQEIYGKTVELYQKELGVRPSANMINRLEEFSTRLEHRSASPADIQRELSEASIERGGFFCTFPIFQGIYRMMRRSLDRCGRYAYLVICTLVNYNKIEDVSDMSPDNEELSRLSDRMKTVICNSVRRSDIVCRFAKDQFLIILMNREVEGCQVVCDRIDRNFRLGGYNIKLEYDISPVREIL